MLIIYRLREGEDVWRILLRYDKLYYLIPLGGSAKFYIYDSPLSLVVIGTQFSTVPSSHSLDDDRPTPPPFVPTENPCKPPPLRSSTLSSSDENDEWCVVNK